MDQTKHLWEYDHPYYANEGCFYTPGTQYHDVHTNWDSWEDFKAEWGDNDPDLNLIYRWDWYRSDPSDYEYEREENPDFEMPGDTLKLFFMLQRNAKPHSHRIKVTEADEPDVRAWLTQRAETIRAIWEPIIAAKNSPTPPTTTKEHRHD
ncbi:hypothetical protein [Glutamicibacter sp. TV12E]|uniref:hypothetical protein n=1 Tax=Glutamicibacter sp. TV12E TaxID=3446362 RepID=UPI00403317F5